MAKFRNGTEDEGIWNAIYVANDYNLHGTWHGTVVDIGGHIGAFACFAADKLLSKQVISVEPNWKNVQLLADNTSKRPMVEPIWSAVAGVPNRRVCRVGAVYPNTGGARYEPAELHQDVEGPILTTTLDELLDTAAFTPVLVKIDCEGAEYEILEAWKNTEKVGAVVGEWHADTEEEMERRTRQLIDIFESRGFVVSVGPKSKPESPFVGLFAAHKRE